MALYSDIVDFTFVNPMIEYVDGPGNVWLWNQMGTNPWASQGMPSNPVVTSEIAITGKLITFPFDWYLTAWFTSKGLPAGDYTPTQLCALYDQYTTYLNGNTPATTKTSWVPWAVGAAAVIAVIVAIAHHNSK